MGLKLRYNLFYRVTPDDVYKAYLRFYNQRHVTLTDDGDEYQSYELYEPNGQWTILSWNIGWEWEIRRKAQLFVSKELHCPGFLIFVSDGIYWGYEFFSDGVVLDHFVQDMDEGKRDFPSDPCVGNAQLLAHYFEWLTVDDIVPYLVQRLNFAADSVMPVQEIKNQIITFYGKFDVPPRGGDEYTRFSPLAALNFLRLLGIKIGVENHYVVPQTPIWKTFWLQPSSQQETK